MDLTATNCAAVTGISIRYVNKTFLKIRLQLTHKCQRRIPFDGEVEIDESYFSPKKKSGYKEDVKQDLKQSSW